VHDIAFSGRYFPNRVEEKIITHAPAVVQSGLGLLAARRSRKAGRTGRAAAARNGEAMLVRVIAVDFRLSPAVRRLARNFSRLTGVPLARLLEPERDWAQQYS